MGHYTGSKRHEIYVRQAEPGIEPGSRDLQSPALPLCYPANSLRYTLQDSNLQPTV